jgi:hypothetical protein
MILGNVFLQSTTSVEFPIKKTALWLGTSELRKVALLMRFTKLGRVEALGSSTTIPVAAEESLRKMSCAEVVETCTFRFL